MTIVLIIWNSSELEIEGWMCIEENRKWFAKEGKWKVKDWYLFNILFFKIVELPNESDCPKVVGKCWKMN